MGGTVPIIRQLRRYDHVAIYFVRRIGKPRFGFEYSDLEPDQRQALGRNTGAVVLIVIEKTPAFYANVVEGDVIIAVDGIERLLGLREAIHELEREGIPTNEEIAALYARPRRKRTSKLQNPAAA